MNDKDFEQTFKASVDNSLPAEPTPRTSYKTLSIFSIIFSIFTIPGIVLSVYTMKKSKNRLALIGLILSIFFTVGYSSLAAFLLYPTLTNSDILPKEAILGFWMCAENLNQPTTRAYFFDENGHFTANPLVNSTQNYMIGDYVANPRKSEALARTTEIEITINPQAFVVDNMDQALNQSFYKATIGRDTSNNMTLQMANGAIYFCGKVKSE
jgi:hypothetical protein